MDPEPLTAEAIAVGLGTRELPRTIRCHGSVGSTQDLARELLRQLPESQLPALVVADEQTAGRGRMGRPWVAPPGTALLASLALRPTWLPAAQGVSLVWMAAVALCEAVEEVTPLRPGLKWPNDLLVAPWSHNNEPQSHDPLSSQKALQAPADRDPRAPLQGAPRAKAAGILLEVTLGVSGIETAIIGCGVNLSAAPPPEATRYPAISLEAAAGAPVGRLALLRALLRRIDAWHTRLRSGAGEALFLAWRARLLTIGQPVRIELSGGPLAGVAEDVDAFGALIVRDSAGVAHTVTAGDVGLTP